jgi:hypothetical protein
VGCKTLASSPHISKYNGTFDRTGFSCVIWAVAHKSEKFKKPILKMSSSSKSVSLRSDNRSHKSIRS